MHTRIKIAIAFAAGAVVFLAISILAGVNIKADTLGTFGNFGSELLGIALTVAVIDWLMERRRLNEQVQQMAWRMLHDVDHAFWVWQGGRREFHLDELIALLGVAEKDDPFPQFTEEMFVNLGIRASDHLRLQPRLMAHDRRLKAAMKSLSGLAQIKEAKRLVDNSYVIEGLKAAVSNLAELTGQTPHAGEFGAARAFRDPAEAAQAKRYRGSIHESIMRHEVFGENQKDANTWDQTPGDENA